MMSGITEKIETFYSRGNQLRRELRVLWVASRRFDIAQNLLRENSGRVPLMLNSNYEYETNQLRRVFAYGFLDNAVHWIDSSGTELHGDG